MKNKTKKAFTLIEAIIVIAIIGLITTLYNISTKVINANEKGYEVRAQKTLENIDQVFNLIFAHHSESFNLTDLHVNNDNFSITDSGAAAKLSNLFKKYMNILYLQDENEDKVKEYYESNILDYDKTSTGITLNGAYSNFITSTNGVIYGFRLYQSCSANEVNSSPPLAKGRGTTEGICGSIFYDVNGYSGPNKLGSDQYIVPFDSLGAKVKR